MPPLSHSPGPPAATAFATVGTTRFDALADALLARRALEALAALGLQRLVVQLGRGAVPAPVRDAAPAAEAALAADPAAAVELELHGMSVSVYRLRASVDADVRAAALVISHAGAGSVFEALRAGRPLLVLTNDALADNHQQELALAMARRGHLVHTTPERLADALARRGPQLLAGAAAPLPPLDRARFVAALDAAAGFAAPA